MTAHVVTVRLRGLLAQFCSPDGAASVAPGRSVLAVAAEIGIPRRQPFVALVNGRTVDLNYILTPGDCLTLLPPIAGG